MKTKRIDAVITWVNGNDPEHQKKRARAQSQISEADGSHVERTALDSTRFGDCGELYYNIRLLRINAPWIRIIHLITDNQRPEWLDKTEETRLGVRLVSHEEIFDGYTHVLPTFNSLSIETVMHRIDGLSDRFIYLNDDVFIVRPTREQDYFRGDQPIFRGWVRARKYGSFWKKMLFERFASPGRIYPDESHQVGLIGTRMGREKVLRFQKQIVNLFHTPQPIVLESYAAAMAPRLERNIGFKFRSSKQFYPVGLYANLLFQKERCSIISPDVAYFDPTVDESLSQERISEKMNAPNVKHACFQSLDEFDETSRKTALAFLDRRACPTRNDYY